MAEEKPQSNPADAILIIALIVVFLFGGTLTVFRHRISSSIAAFSGRYAFSESTPAGSRVGLERDTPVWSAPEESIVGVQSGGARGEIAGGPLPALGERWWEIDFQDAPDGWVPENSLMLVSGLVSFVKTVKVIAGTLSFLFLTLIIYARWRIGQVRTREAHELKLPPPGAFEGQGVKNERWEHVEALASSENPSDWRAAIIEADIMLDELVSSMGYDGDGLGEKMKKIEESDFTTLNQAWEAHKVRNRIAHDGRDYILTQREARRVIELFREVFDEFRII